jgi:CheY-like chemotaxis protein
VDWKNATNAGGQSDEDGFGAHWEAHRLVHSLATVRAKPHSIGRQVEIPSRVLVRRFVPNKRLKVMVVDDHAAFRGMVRSMLETAGCQCVECQDGQEAVEQYEQLWPDLVLMDISMVHLDGLRATAQIKTRFPAARVMMLTQYDETDLRAAARQGGACGYILKENLMGLSTAIQAQIQEEAATNPSTAVAGR